jgi:hypothetical protein
MTSDKTLATGPPHQWGPRGLSGMRTVALRSMLIGAGILVLAIAGVAAGAASASATANPPGTLYGTLPADCSYQAVTAQPYYHCADGLWFVPAYGANGVYYRVVTAP